MGLGGCGIETKAYETKRSTVLHLSAARTHPQRAALRTKDTDLSTLPAGPAGGNQVLWSQVAALVEPSWGIQKDCGSKKCCTLY